MGDTLRTYEGFSKLIKHLILLGLSDKDVGRLENFMRITYNISTVIASLELCTVLVIAVFTT